MATITDVKVLAGQLNIAYTDYGQVFDLDSKPGAALEFNGTFRKSLYGIDAAYDALVKHQANLSTLPTTRKE